VRHKDLVVDLGARSAPRRPALSGGDP